MLQSILFDYIKYLFFFQLEPGEKALSQNIS